MNVLRSHCCLSTRLRKVIQTTFTILPRFSTTSTAFSRDQSPETERRRQLELPKELTKNVIQLSCDSMAKGGVCDVYLVGTLHGTKESSKQVEEIVKFLKPEIVFLELCSDRQEVLFHDEMKPLTMEEIIAMRKEKYSIFRILLSWLDAEIDSRRGFYPGAEFRSAYKEVTKYGGEVVLGDRPLEITLKRTWSKLPLWHILKLLIPCFPSTYSASLSLYDNLLTWFELLVYKRLPTVRETMVHERDRYMSHALLKVASESRTVVAVVGEGHLEGMKKNWKQPIKIDPGDSGSRDNSTSQTGFPCDENLCNCGYCCGWGDHNINRPSLNGKNNFPRFWEYLQLLVFTSSRFLVYSIDFLIKRLLLFSNSRSSYWWTLT